MKKGYMYILECSDGSYYTGSTTNLELRLQQHQSGEGANHTKKRLPVTLVYYQEYSRIDEAFYREKQVQGWSRKKKEALINGNPELLPQLAVAYRDLKNSGGLENINGGFENLNHQETTVSSSASDTEILSASDTRAISLPEALEGSDKETLKDTVTPSKNEYQ
ncbi:MAG TPA: GIY-YIG nuclease family protein [Paludibacteraceae bacterium]|nr:GIY-YIG nuclease family protein [Paludibacteraceae bacterium]